jgi:hypothetical protein
MDDAQGPGQPQIGVGAEEQLEGRYAIGARLGQDGRGMQTFSATDRWLHRPVIMVFGTGSGGRALTKTCQSMVGVSSPNLIDIYDRGGNVSYRFVVCEHPATTVASLVQQPDRRIWNETLAIATAKQLAVALSDLHRSGVETRGLHLGSIGIDGSGRVRLSPWPLAESPALGDGSAAPLSELDLLAWVLESAAYPAGSRISPTTAGLAARLRERSREGAALTLDQLRAALGRLEPSVYDRATGEVPAVTAAMAATGADAATGMVSAATGAEAATGVVSATTGAEAATGVVSATTGAVAFGQDVESHIYRRRRHRARWPLAVGAGVAGLVAFLAISLGSSSSPLPAAASTNGAGACASKTKGCPTGAASQSPSATTVTTAPVTPVTAPDAGSGVDVAASGPTTTTTTTSEPSATTTTTTTTTDPSSTTTTTAPESTTTTTDVPTTTTTTAAAPPTPGGLSAPAGP